MLVTALLLVTQILFSHLQMNVLQLLSHYMIAAFLLVIHSAISAPAASYYIIYNCFAAI